MPEVNVSEALTLATRTEEVNFPEFTAKLITDTMDAVVAATVRQQESYSDLLSRISKALPDFARDEITEFEVNQWLAETFPSPDAMTETDVENMTTLREGRAYTAVTRDAANIITAPDDPPIVYMLHAEFSELEIDDLPTGDLTAEHVANIKRAVRLRLAKTRKSVLERVLETGYARIVIDSGRIHSKLVFRTEGQSFRSKISTEYNRKAWNVGGRASLISGIFRIGLGGGISQLKVKTLNEKSTDWTRVNVDITGGIDINFHTDYATLD